MMYVLTNKVILITGAANGIGAEIVNRFLLEGAKQVTFLDIDEVSGNRLQEKLRIEYGEEKIKFIKCDVTKEDQLFGAFNTVVDQHGYIDIVVNNAGLGDESTMDRIRKEIEVNYTAVVQSTIKALEIMRTDNGGRGGTIINVSSIASLCQSSPALFVYLGTKSAVMQFSNCIGKQEYYSTTGVRVLTVCFGITNTEIMNKIRSFDDRINKNIQDAINLFQIQEKNSAALGLVEAYRHGESGSTWLVANDKPALNKTENIRNAYSIMSEPLANSS